MTGEQVAKLAVALSDRFDRSFEVVPPVSLDDVELPASRVEPPAGLAAICSADRHDRASHTYGRSYRDVVRGHRGELTNPPDLVARPRSEEQVVDLLDWCSAERLAAIPFGGGSSVVGGVEADVGDGYAGAISIDLTGLDRVLDVDRESRSARIQAGTLGPVLEDQLRPHDLTLRHFPQSFEFSTLGGWLATRSGGHYATVLTHIDDMVESLRIVTPAGISESRRLPGSGAGPSPDRMFLGSEGALGIITEAWMRVQDRPRFKGAAGVHFGSYAQGVEATRALSQSGLHPTNCRLLDAGEALLSAGSAVDGALLVLGFESAHHSVGPWLEQALELCGDHGGSVPDGPKLSEADEGGASREGAVGAWRNAFVRAPYTRDGLVQAGVLAETFETACTWDRFADLHAEVTATTERMLADVCGAGWVTCRFTHVYPDGPAPYFSVLAPARRGSELEQWRDIKEAVSDVLDAHGATITHHHAVGRDHDRWYRRQRPELFGRALAAVKRELDPAGILNPGVIAAP
jgi:alkyldihydroxyacetonephosphate synthase